MRRLEKESGAIRRSSARITFEAEEEHSLSRSRETRRGKYPERHTRAQSSGEHVNSTPKEDDGQAKFAGEDRAKRIRGLISGMLDRLTTW